MAIFQGSFFLVLGVLLVIADLRSLSRGWLPCGPKGLKGRLELQRSGQPVAFWGLFGLYLVSGLALAVFALRLLAGSAEPLPLR